jgi:hypothetical protein
VSLVLEAHLGDFFLGDFEVRHMACSFWWMISSGLFAAAAAAKFLCDLCSLSALFCGDVIPPEFMHAHPDSLSAEFFVGCQLY